MDHLWLDQENMDEPDHVPYYGVVQYDGAAYPTWLSRQGFENYDKLCEAISSPDESQRMHALSIAQEWFFFGVLSEFCVALNTSFRRDEFIATAEKGQRLSTANLHKVAESCLVQQAEAFNAENPALVEWIFAIERERDPSYAEEKRQHIKARIPKLREKNPYGEMIRWLQFSGTQLALSDTNIVQRLETVLRCSSGLLANSTSRTVLPVVDWLCYWVLLESIRNFCIFVDDKNTWIKLDLDTVVASEMGKFWAVVWESWRLRGGICPQRLSTHSTSSVSETYIASLLRLYSSLDHRECSNVFFCRASTPKAELPLHTAACRGDCELIRIEGSDMAAIERSIKGGFYGLLRFSASDADGGHGLGLEVCEHVNGTEIFVAFSHVWTHGMANPTLNALPTCQIRRLREAMKELNCEDEYFWLDPLCVPIDSSSKQLAINGMSAVYSNASKVIVLDKGLQSLKGNMHIKLLGMVHSDWMARLWTLQEAVLPQDKLHIAFGDGIIPISAILDDWEEIQKPLSVTARSLIVPCSAYHRVIGLLLRTARRGRLMSIMSNFATRNASNKEDEARCLAILMNVDMSRFPTIPSLKDVFEELPAVDQDIIFTRAPRMTSPGFRWCPSTFMALDSRTNYSPDRPEPAPRSSRGLRMTANLAVLDPSFAIEVMRDTETERYFSEPFILRFSPHVEEPEALWFKAILQTMAAPHLHPRFIRHAGLVFRWAWTEGVFDSEAVLVSDIRTGADGVLEAHYECQLSQPNASRVMAHEAGGKKLVESTQREVALWLD